jgi:restriction endonuclease S subunit
MAIEIPFFPLKEIGRIVKREIRLEPNGEYKTVGCKLYGLGVYERETKGGSDIQAKRMFLIEENDFLINRIWAQKGSVGIVPPELEGSVVTNDFPVIELDLTRVYPPYISWYVKTREFWETCRKHSRGTSGRERLSPKELPNIEIPLPDIEEQKRIVARIESLIARIEEARRLRDEAAKEIENLTRIKSKFFDGDLEKWDKKRLYEVISINMGQSPSGHSYNSLSDGVPSEYVYHFVETQTPKMLTLAAGSTFPNLPGAKFKKLLIPVPPLPEQRRIVAYLDSLQAKVDELKRLQAETEKELEELVSSILDIAMAGYYEFPLFKTRDKSGKPSTKQGRE